MRAVIEKEIALIMNEIVIVDAQTHNCQTINLFLKNFCILYTWSF